MIPRASCQTRRALLLCAAVLALAPGAALAGRPPQEAREPLRRGRLEVITDRGAPVAERVAAIEVSAELPAAETVAIVARVLAPGEPPEVQSAAVRAMARTGLAEAASCILEALSGLTPRLRGEALHALLSRAAWSDALLEALRAESLNARALPGTAIYRLRNHPDAVVAAKARGLLAVLSREASSGPEARWRVIERLAPLVTRGDGDVESGAALFARHCGACHQVDGRGTDIGPDLTGMALYGAESLLVDIVDPSRAVDGAFFSYAVTTRMGLTLAGIVASENAEQVVLKRSDGIDIVPRSEILALESQGISLMPDGLEKTMTVEELRDLLTYMAGRSPYRALDLRLAANADGSRGLFSSQVNAREALPFSQFGAVAIDGTPFLILSPATTGGRSLIVLRGGPDKPDIPARSYPARAEVPCGVAAKAIHVLGGVGGWAYPGVREEFPVMTVKIHYSSGELEAVEWRNGVEIADYSGFHEVRGSKRALRLGHRQVRRISLVPARQEEIERLELISASGPVAPVVVAITVEKL